MKNEIICVFTLMLEEGMFLAFSQLVAKIVAATHQQPGTISYVYMTPFDGFNR